ncbi:MAG: ATP-binding cassette domain-containing protein [Candidatus Moduliflexus flocculans]|nr:ATP-binding cassette domain-containing protein [Candidatus Moduliflexus flocculans]
MSLATNSREKKVAQLSGGNQQKVVISKCLNRESDVLLMDEPTRGVDVGAKQEIHDIIRSLANQGKGVIVFSSELPEIVQLCDRIVLMYEGTVRTVLENGKDIDSDRIMALVAGGEVSAMKPTRDFRKIVRDPKFLMLLLLVLLNVFFALNSETYFSVENYLQHAQAVGHDHHRRLGGHDPDDDGQLRPLHRQQPGPDGRGLHLLLASGGMALWPAAVIAILCGIRGRRGQRNPGGQDRVPPFIATLGTMYVARGLALILAKGSPVRGEKVPRDVTTLARGRLAGGPHPRLLPRALRRSCSR